MPKEIIRTLGQLEVNTTDDLIIYAVPEGHSAVISKLMLTNIALASGTPSIIVAVEPRGSILAQGRTTARIAFKLIDSRAKFTETATIGDKVQSAISGQTTVSAVDGDTQLSVVLDLFNPDEDYIISNDNSNAIEYIRNNKVLAVSETLEISGITLSEFAQIRIISDLAGVACSCFGVEITANE